MIVMVVGADTRMDIISDVESTSEAMEVFRDRWHVPAETTEIVSLTEADDDMSDAFGESGG